MSRKLIVAVSVGVAFSAGILQFSAASAQIPDRIKIAAFGSVTGSNAASNVAMFYGIKLAVDEINKAGGVAGKPIELIMADDMSDSTAAVTTARRLTEQDHINASIGPFTSQFVLAVTPIMNQTKTLNLHVAASTALTPQVSNYGFGMVTPSDVQGRMQLDYAVDVLKAKSVAFIGDNGGSAKIAGEAIKAQAAKRGVNLVSLQEYEFRASDVTPQMLSMRRANPDVLLMWPLTGEDHGLIMKTRSELGWNVKVVNGGGTALQVPIAGKVFPDSFKDLPSVMLKSWTYCSGDPLGKSPLVQFKDRLKAFAGAEDYKRIGANYSAFTYDATYIIKAAIEATKSVDGSVLTRWLESNAKSIKGRMSGPMDASPTNHFLVSTSDAMAMVVDTDKPREDGLYRRVTDCK